MHIATDSCLFVPIDVVLVQFCLNCFYFQVVLSENPLLANDCNDRTILIPLHSWSIWFYSDCLCGSLVGFGPHIGRIFVVVFASIQCFFFPVMFNALVVQWTWIFHLILVFNSHSAIWICLDHVYLLALPTFDYQFLLSLGSIDALLHNHIICSFYVEYWFLVLCWFWPYQLSWISFDASVSSSVLSYSIFVDCCLTGFYVDRF